MRIRTDRNRVVLDRETWRRLELAPHEVSAAVGSFDRLRQELTERENCHVILNGMIDLFRSSNPDAMIEVPSELRTRLDSLVVKLACVAYFSRAPEKYIAEAVAFLERAPGGKHQKEWQKALVVLLTPDRKVPRSDDLVPHLFLERNDEQRPPRTILAYLALNLIQRAPEAPLIFHRIVERIPDARRPHDEVARIAKAVAVLARLRATGIQPPNKRGGGGRPGARAAAAEVAAALGHPFEGRASRLNR